MKLLLDTHAFIWIDSEPDRVPASVQSALADPETEVFVSVVSLWEIAVKQGIGKLKLSMSLPDALKTQQRVSDLKVLPITPEHVWPLESLPLLHKDPFDRLLIAQAIAEDLTIATVDPLFADYPVRTLW
jgi:PIN domain nuclease of toxin-antitoxin system